MTQKPKAYEGVPTDYAEAKKLFRAARKKGNTDAKKSLRLLSTISFLDKFRGKTEK